MWVWTEEVVRLKQTDLFEPFLERWFISSWIGLRWLRGTWFDHRIDSYESFICESDYAACTINLIHFTHKNRFIWVICSWTALHWLTLHLCLFLRAVETTQKNIFSYHCFAVYCLFIITANSQLGWFILFILDSKIMRMCQNFLCCGKCVKSSDTTRNRT